MKSVFSVLLSFALAAIVGQSVSAQGNQAEEILPPGPTAAPSVVEPVPAEPLTVSPLELTAPNEIHSTQRPQVPSEVAPEYEIVPHHSSPQGYYPPREVVTVRYAEPGWLGVVFAQGELKEHIESLPMELRPYRPFHFYGNTVRRLHYRGNALPTIGDIQNSTRSLFGLPTK